MSTARTTKPRPVPVAPTIKAHSPSKPAGRLAYGVAAGAVMTYTGARRRHLEAQAAGDFSADRTPATRERNLAIIEVAENIRDDAELRVDELIDLLVPDAVDGEARGIIVDDVLVISFPARELAGSDHSAEGWLLATVRMRSVVDLDDRS